MSFSTTIMGQRLIHGKTLEMSNEISIEGVMITENGTSNSQISDKEGSWKIYITGDTITLSKSGYQSMVLLPNDNDFQKVYLSATPSTDIETITISANRSGATQAASSLDKSKIQINSPTSIQPTLNLVPGVYMHSGTQNTNRITIRGIGSRSPFATSKIKAYLDDIPLTSGIGEASIEDINLDLFQKISIHKGPTSGRYGAGLGGMIHLQTSNLANHPPTSAGFTFTSGSYGLIRTSENFNYQSNSKKVNFSIGHDLIKSDGYRDNNEYEKESIDILSKIFIGKGQLTLLANFIDLRAQIPSSLDYTDYKENPQKAAFTWAQIEGFEDYNKNLFGASYIHYFDETWKLTTTFFANTRDSYESRPFNIIEEENDALGVRLISEANIKKFNLHLGLETFDEKYLWRTYVTQGGMQGNLISDNEEDRDYINIFGGAIFQFKPKWKLQTSLNINTTKYRLQNLFNTSGIDQSGEYTFEAVLSPNIELTYRASPLTQLFAKAAHGFSAPTLEETLTPAGLINPDIKPEKGWNYELGIEGSMVDHKLNYSLSIYTMIVNDLLVGRRTALDEYLGVNAGKTRHTGIDLSADYDLLRADDHRLNLYMAYSWADYKFVDFEDDGNVYSGNELTGTAPHLIRLLLNGQYRKFYGNIHFQYTDKMPLRDDNSFYSESFSNINMKMGYTTPLFQILKLDMQFGLNNVMDSRYASMVLINAAAFGNTMPRYYYPGLPRNYYVTVGVKYTIK